ncbi:MAG: DUF4268 domain-containing protein [Nitrospirae bacterium]|nr:DUF4268 domain-containing protein [Nitrospirota bacterium]
MYLIDKAKNRIDKLTKKSFSELGFKERENLQVWLENNPEALGEEMLIIQKEFSGFSDTNERLDLLALDKQGNLVVIENKLDDSGRDVTWQVLKYASYCSSLSKEQVKDIYQEYLNKKDGKDKAEDKLSEFFDNDDYEELLLNKGLTQRIIMVSGNFRKEVTSTALWLLNYKLRIQCFQVSPFEMGSQLFLNIEQIIPIKDAEEFIISMADKTQDDINSQETLKTRHIIRREFWTQLLKEMNKSTHLYQNISPAKEHWIGAGSGVRGVGFVFVISKSYGRCELYIDRGEFKENKFVFDTLLQQKDSIEKAFGAELIWERLDKKRASRIKYELEGVNVFEKEDWAKMTEFMKDGMLRMEKALKEPLQKINAELKRKFKSQPDSV